MSLKGKTLLKGHTLRYEGDAFNEHGTLLNRGGAGMAKCSCGALSEVLPSRSARKRWHREHKDLLRKEAG